MVGKSQIKFVSGLQQKKIRKQKGLFIAEGIKLIDEFLNTGFGIFKLYTTHPELFKIKAEKIVVVSSQELKQLSNQKTPNAAIALFKIPKPQTLSKDGLLVALQDVQDPGNLGTIIRLCDWFGVKDLVCSPTTADCYNPKVVQASMGSLARVRVHYFELMEFLKDNSLNIYGAFTKGKNVYHCDLPKKGILLMGNEGGGISEEISGLVDHKITIPSFSKDTESLNVATATAILLNEFRRS